MDLDNDGFLDIFVANGHVYPEIDVLNVETTFLQRKEIYRNLGDGTFDEVGTQIGGDIAVGRSTRGLAFSDFDNDGDLDAIAININDRPNLYRNDAANPNHWVSLRLEGVESNRDAIGARIEIDAGGSTQTGTIQSGGSYLSHNDLRAHFGIGTSTRVDRIRIDWPNGRTEELHDIDADQFITIREGEGIVRIEP